jgi:hypothetical protein
VPRRTYTGRARDYFFSVNSVACTCRHCGKTVKKNAFAMAGHLNSILCSRRRAAKG